MTDLADGVKLPVDSIGLHTSVAMPAPADHLHWRPPPGRAPLVPGWALGVGAALLYGGCSTSMAFANKGLLSGYGFSHQATLMAFQMAFTIVVLELLRCVGAVDIPPYSVRQGLTFALPSLFYALNSVLGLRALTDMNIPMYTVIKRCTPAACLLLRPLLLSPSAPPTPGVICSVVMVTAGCVIAAQGDLTFDLAAYTYGTGSVLVQGVYLTLLQRDTQEKLSTAHSLYLNSYNTLPLLTFSAAASGELQRAADFPSYSELGFVLLSLTVVGMGCLLNYSMFLCTKLNSALTTTIVGGMKGVAQTVIGVFTFGGIDVNLFSVMGMTVNASGGLLYAFSKFRQRT